MAESVSLNASCWDVWSIICQLRYAKEDQNLRHHWVSVYPDASQNHSEMVLYSVSWGMPQGTRFSDNTDGVSESNSIMTLHVKCICLFCQLRYATEDQIQWQHSLRHLELAKDTSTMSAKQLKELAKKYDSWYCNKVGSWTVLAHKTKEQWMLLVECCFTSTENVGLLGTGSPGQPPWLSHSSRALSSGLVWNPFYNRLLWDDILRSAGPFQWPRFKALLRKSVLIIP